MLHEEAPPRQRRQLLAREVVRIVFYMPHDHPELSLGVSHAIDSYIHGVGQGPQSINYVYFSHDEGMRLEEEQWSWVRRLLETTKRRSFPADYEPWERREIQKRGYERRLRFTGGEDSQNGYQLEYRARIPWRPAPERTMASVLTATLPIEFLEEHGPGRVRQLALDMASMLSFASGHVGLALELDWCLRPADNAFRAQVLRYPGIDLRAAWRHERWMGHHVDGVHWLNFLGPPTLTQLGGAIALKSRLDSAETTLVELDEQRVLVSLGERPEAGDLATGTSLPAYRELARVLEPWLEPLFLDQCWDSERDPRYTKLVLTEEEARRWWRRFLD
ncbi:hypothetical protein CYFUS_004813 [Cystobacter fuscus]|uniref:DUF3396 domain-containing protein n=1 Tax=Cystobacter fuscus TaxID=43 RepID=A0A250J607_9BACT|nr:hypothetical protein CYFUS_004813 [Cystobacter fuscus]